MKSRKPNLTAIALATSMALGSIAAIPSVANAEVASSATLASMYLWRGQDVSDGAPALSGDIKYSHASGLYAFGWMSSEGTSGSVASDNTTTPATGDVDSYEVDFGAGYAGSFGKLGYDVSYYKFWYPEGGEKFSDAGAEWVVGLTFEPVTFTAFLDAKGDKTYKYYTLSGSVGPVGLKVGMTDNDAAGTDYKHYDITYNATDRLSFTYSKPFSIDASAGVDDDPLFVLSYSLPIDIK